MAASLSWLHQFDATGYALLSNVADAGDQGTLRDQFSRAGGRVGDLRRPGSFYAARRALDVPAIHAWASREGGHLARTVLGGAARPVRGILFDKTPEANWPVAWHQDLTISVRERREAQGYGPWSVKADVPHVQPPAHVLDGMVTVRLHLDDCSETNGALRVIPGSHRAGKLSPQQVRAAVDAGPVVTCEAQAGDVLLMRPLLLHSSAPALIPSHRRVVHIEYAAASLAPGLEWAEGTAAPS